jgi:electron transport complex protein RnfE
MPKVSLWEEFVKGIVKNNPVLVLTVGLCPTLAVTTGVKNALAMGVAVIAVLTCSNAIISMLRRVIPQDIRIPCFIVVVASFVTAIEIIFKAYLPSSVNAALGIFIPLIVVNCIILYRAEAFAYKNGVLASIMDGLGAGVGFTCAACLVATLRESLGSGTIWGYPWVPGFWPLEYVPASILIQAPGAFLVLGLTIGAVKWLRMRKAAA